MPRHRECSRVSGTADSAMLAVTASETQGRCRGCRLGAARRWPRFITGDCAQLRRYFTHQRFDFLFHKKSIIKRTLWSLCQQPCACKSVDQVEDRSDNSHPPVLRSRNWNLHKISTISSFYKSFLTDY